MTSYNAENWLHSHGESFIRRIRVQRGQYVLDLGCRDGRYTLPAAKAVGPEGCVYANDKDTQQLQTLRQKICNLRLDNIRVLRVTGSGCLPVPPEAVDVALIYDVLHGGYFPQANQPIDLLRQVYLATKPGRLLSCYLTHVKKYHLTFRQLQHEIGLVGFSLEAQAHRKLVHDDHLVRGWIFRYTKPVPASTPKKSQSPHMKN